MCKRLFSLFDESYLNLLLSIVISNLSFDHEIVPAKQIAIFDDEYAMVGCLNGGIDNEYLIGIGDKELGIGAFQPYYTTETRLVFDTDNDWKTIGDEIKTPEVYKNIFRFLYLQFWDIMRCTISYQFASLN